MLKIMVLTPMPSASTATTTAVKPGVRRSERSAKRTSWIRVSMAGRLRSLVAQRHDGVHTDGASGGQPGRSRGAQSEDERDAHERGRVVGPDPEQQTLHEPREDERQRQAEPDAEQRQAQRLT